MNPDESILVGSATLLVPASAAFLILNGYWNYISSFSVSFGLFYPLVGLLPIYLNLDLSESYKNAYIWVLAQFLTLPHLPLLIKLADLGFYGFVYLILSFWISNGIMVPLKIINNEEYGLSFIVAGNIGFVGFFIIRFIWWLCDQPVDSEGNIVPNREIQNEIIPHLVIPVDPMVYEDPPSYEDPPKYEIF